MVHAWTKYTDGNGSTVRVVLFDYKKAFDLIDHMTEKLTKLDLPYEIICWIVDFLKCRKQRIKLSNDCKSEWSNVPWLFVLMIEDIKVTNTDLWKYVDDTMIAIFKTLSMNCRKCQTEISSS